MREGTDRAASITLQEGGAHSRRWSIISRALGDLEFAVPLNCGPVNCSVVR